MKQKIRCGGLAALLAGASASAIFRLEDGLTYAYLPTEVSPLLIAAVSVLFFAFFFAWLLRNGKKQDPAALATALLFSLWFAISSTISADPAEFNSFSIPSVPLRLVGVLPLCYAAVSWAYAFLDRWQTKPSSLVPVSGKKESHIRLCLAGMLTVLWIPFFIQYFPGNVTYDTGTAILEYYGAIEHPNNPWFLTWLYGTIIRTGDHLGNADIALFLFCLIQALLFALILADLFLILRQKGAPLLLIAFFLLLYGTLPPFSSYAFCMGKDSSFALCLLWLGDALLRFREAESHKTGWNCVSLATCCILTPLTRNGVWIPLLLLLIFMLIKKAGGRKFLAVTALLVVITGAGVPCLTNQQSSITENLSIPIQQVARTLKIYERNMSDAEKEQYKKLMKLPYWRKYKSGISDPVKKRFNSDPSGEYLHDFLSLWITEAQKHPETYLGAAILMNYAYYTPTADRSDLKRKLFLGTQSSRIESLEGITTLTKNENPGLTRIQDFIDFLERTPILRLLTRIGGYTWILAAAFSYCISRRRKEAVWLLLLPVTVFIGCCFSPVNGYYRYAFPIIVSVPVFCSLVFFQGSAGGINSRKEITQDGKSCSSRYFK